MTRWPTVALLLAAALACPAAAQQLTVDVATLQARQAEPPPFLVFRGASIAAPEPAAMGLLGGLLTGAGLLRHWRRRSAG